MMSFRLSFGSLLLFLYIAPIFAIPYPRPLSQNFDQVQQHDPAGAQSRPVSSNLLEALLDRRGTLLFKRSLPVAMHEPFSNTGTKLSPSVSSSRPTSAKHAIKGQQVPRPNPKEEAGQDASCIVKRGITKIDCSIRREAHTGRQMLTTPCGHLFCKNCLPEWNKHSVSEQERDQRDYYDRPISVPSCPTCRRASASPYVSTTPTLEQLDYAKEVQQISIPNGPRPLPKYPAPTNVPDHQAGGFLNLEDGQLTGEDPNLPTWGRRADLGQQDSTITGGLAAGNVYYPPRVSHTNKPRTAYPPPFRQLGDGVLLSGISAKPRQFGPIDGDYFTTEQGPAPFEFGGKIYKNYVYYPPDPDRMAGNSRW